jgi:hypothetical protein
MLAVEKFATSFRLMHLTLSTPHLTIFLGGRFKFSHCADCTETITANHFQTQMFTRPFKFKLQLTNALSCQYISYIMSVRQSGISGWVISSTDSSPPWKPLQSLRWWYLRSSKAPTMSCYDPLSSILEMQRISWGLVWWATVSVDVTLR